MKTTTFFIGLYMVFVVFSASAVAAEIARTIDVTLRINARVDPAKEGEPPKPEPILSRANLIAIKQFILKQGKTQTYCNMYNDNPYFGVKDYNFYLNPDTGPNNYPQFNINSDPKLADYHTLFIREAGCKIQFKDKYDIYIVVSGPNDDLSIGKIRGGAEEAIKVILEEIKRIEKSSKPEAVRSTG